MIFIYIHIFQYIRHTKRDHVHLDPNESTIDMNPSNLQEHVSSQRSNVGKNQTKRQRPE